MAKVLVIDDHDDTRELMRVVLGHAGHDVSVAADGDEGLLRYGIERPHVVVVDIFMPRLNGMAVIESLRAGAGAAVRLIAISASWTFGGGDVRHEAARRGADLVLRKPLDFDVLLAAVKDLATAA